MQEIPENLKFYLHLSIKIKSELGKISSLVLMRRLKITQKKAEEILTLLC